MKNILLVVAFLTTSLISCNKSANNTNSTNSTVDPNNYFTATFSGKTLKTNGLILNIGGVQNYGVSFGVMGASIQTTNNSGGVSTSLLLSVLGSTMNSAWSTQYQFPTQSCDASIWLTKTGNALGNYTLDPVFIGLGVLTITDLTVGNKKYEIDPSTVFTVTLADATYVQGIYSGSMVDGSTKIPVTGTFKLRKN